MLRKIEYSPSTGPFSSRPMRPQASPGTKEHKENMEHMAKEIRKCIVHGSFGSNPLYAFRRVKPEDCVSDEKALQTVELRKKDGISRMEAIQAYIDIQHQQRNSHDELAVYCVGFYVSHSHPFIGASPDGGACDPSSDQPYGFMEVKCPCHTVIMIQYSLYQYCTLKITEKGNAVTLRWSQNYFCQVQGQMAVGDRPWCDFVVYTPHGISVERIKLNVQFWDKLLTKLSKFFDKRFAPEIVKQ